ncbi:MAG TPA: hypothetical protein VGO51_17460 [Burkholderiaceae bacterium]|nr:hypothetical protein [Burkholderiaceae bacterium]
MTKRKVVQPDSIDLLLADYKKQEDLIGKNGLLRQLAKAIFRGFRTGKLLGLWK